MKPVVALLLLLCVLLIGSNHFALASDQKRNLCYLNLELKDNQQPSISIPLPGSNLSKNAGYTDKDNCITIVEDDEDTENNIRKYLSVTRYAVIISYALTSIYNSSSLTKQTAFSTGLPYTGSCKYIIQRTL